MIVFPVVGVVALLVGLGVALSRRDRLFGAVVGLGISSVLALGATVYLFINPEVFLP